MPLYSFGAGMSVVVVGASGGIGRALTSILSASPAVARITACSRSGAVPEHPKVRHQRLDLEDEATIAGAAEAVQADGGVLDLVFVASGILHADEALRPEKTWRALDGAALERVYRINAVGPALVAKHFLPLLARVFAALSARVGSISDNHLGGWHAYRASKAALNMLLRTFAIELARRNLRAVCVGLHPGTVDTGLSAPFQTNVPEGKLFTPDFAAARLLEVVDRLKPDDSGKVFAWDGQTIPPQAEASRLVSTRRFSLSAVRT
jgi:NAD(P)-dependent dehydrogenase (short-subunit alcohol dehydrogenase family)